MVSAAAIISVQDGNSCRSPHPLPKVSDVSHTLQPPNHRHYAPPPPYLPAPNARPSECAVYCSVLVVVDVVEVNVIMGAGKGSLAVDVVEVKLLWVPACIR